MNPSQSELSTRLSPDSFQANYAGDGLFRAVGSNAIFRRIGNKIVSFDPVSLLSDQERQKAGDYGTQTAIALQRLQQQYGFNPNSLPQVNIGDMFQADPTLQRASQTGLSVSTNDVGQILGQPAAQISSRMMDTQSNTLGTPPAAPAAQSTTSTAQNTATAGSLPLPSTQLQPGATGPQVKQLQSWLVANGLMTQAQMNTAPGVYGPQTTAAVAALQKKLGVDNSSGVGYFGPRTIAAAQSAATQAAAPGNGQSAGPDTSGNGSGINFSPTGDASMDKVLESITGVANNLVSNGYTIPAGLQITPDLVKQFLGYAHQAIDPYTQQLLTSRLADVNASLSTMATEYNNSVGQREQQFGTDLATEQNAAGGAGTAFSGQRNVNELNLQNTANRDLSNLGNTAAYNMGAAARGAASDVGSANAGGIVLPTLSNGSVSLSGGQRGSVSTSAPLSYDYTPSLYTAGNIKQNQANAVDAQYKSYTDQYGQLANAQSNTGRSVSDLIGMIPSISSLPGYTPYKPQ